jgi:hypothetical protein
MTEKQLLGMFEQLKDTAHDDWLTANRQLDHYNEHGDLNDTDTAIAYERIEADAWSRYTTLREVVLLVETAA